MRKGKPTRVEASPLLPPRAGLQSPSPWGILRFVPSYTVLLFALFAACPEPNPPAPYDDDFDGFADDEDCDDHNSFVYPGAPELCDERDNDCDGEIDEGVETFPE